MAGRPQLATNLFRIFVAFQVKGEAQAFAIEAKATAEAEQMAKKADAWKEYQEAAMVDMMLDTLPKVLDLIHTSFLYLGYRNFGSTVGRYLHPVSANE